MERMLIRNAKHIDKSDEIPRVLTNFGGTSFVFMENGKKQQSIKKLFKTGYKGEDNVRYLEQSISKVTMARLKTLRERSEAVAGEKA